MALPIPSTWSVRVMVPAACSSSNVLVWSKSWIKTGKFLKRPFLDIKETVVSSFLEQGLYDLEFHPDFKNNRKFYVHYSDMWFNGDSFIVEYQAPRRIIPTERTSIRSV